MVNRITSSDAYPSKLELISWAFSVKTENINQKLLLVFLASNAEEFGYFDYIDTICDAKDVFGEDVLDIHEIPENQATSFLLNMTGDDIGHAYIGLKRIGLIFECPSYDGTHKLVLNNKKGATF